MVALHASAVFYFESGSKSAALPFLIDDSSYSSTTICSAAQIESLGLLDCVSRKVASDGSKNFLIDFKSLAFIDP